MKNINSILKEVLGRIKPSKEELQTIDKSLQDFIIRVQKNMKSQKINAEVFVGGSFAKDTMIRKGSYDIDIFIRFDKKHKDISNLTKKLLRNMKNVSKIHGSRDYFRIKSSEDLFLEVVPVKKVNNPKEAENITDLSYSHVKYIKKRVKSKKILDDILLAKAFCYGNDCYGAESHVSGFSGYALELLVYHYGGFLKFLRAMAKIKDKEVIDIEKHHKTKQHVLMDINAAKLDSPIVLIDPTYKQRNALAALSNKTFRKFQKTCSKFLKNSTIKAFEIERIDFKKIQANAKKKGYEFILVESKTNKQEGAIAGSKLLKFYNHLGNEIKKYFDVKDRDFEYNGKKSAKYYFVVKKKPELLIQGPMQSQKEHVKKFKKKYSRTFVKNKRIYTKQKIKFPLKKFLEDWKKKHAQKIKDMAISELQVF
ncbi:MAG TPA: nucleotidyltransferase domain-containing protein [Bacillota bacterium]|nr:nucleotidyltransferase domain-containing protein [Bacillota bacterium]